MAIEIPGLNTNSGLELCDGNMDIYLRSLNLYISNIPATLEKMRNVTEETLRDYAVNVHGIKGSSEYIGAEEARKTAKELEMMAKGGDLAGVQARNDAFIKYVENIISGIKSWLEKNNASGA